LRVEAALDPGEDPTGVAISKERFDALPLRRHATHSAWNYTLHPAPPPPPPSPNPSVSRMDLRAGARPCSAG
jgi:hypothetical protein